MGQAKISENIQFLSRVPGRWLQEYREEGGAAQSSRTRRFCLPEGKTVLWRPLLIMTTSPPLQGGQWWGGGSGRAHPASHSQKGPPLASERSRLTLLLRVPPPAVPLCSGSTAAREEMGTDRQKSPHLLAITAVETPRRGESLMATAGLEGDRGPQITVAEPGDADCLKGSSLRKDISTKWRSKNIFL